MNIELSEDDRGLLLRSLSRSLYDLEAVYKRNVNFNKSYAESVFEHISRYALMYTRISGCEFIFDSKSLVDRIYGQVNMVLV